MYELARELGAWLLLTLAILQLGRRLLAHAPPLPRLERFPLAWILGSCAFSLAVTLLAAIHLIGAPVLLALCAACLILRRPPALPTSRPPILALLPAFFLAIYGITALAPGADSDGLRYHLGFPRLYQDSGGLRPIPEDFYAAFPQAIEMLYLAALQLGGIATANLLHWNFLAALCLSLWSAARRLGHETPGLLAATALASAPVIGTNAAAAGVDLALAAAIWTSAQAALRWRQSPTPFWLYTAALTAGFCAGIKYTGITAIAFSAIILTATRPRPRQFLQAAALAALPIAPWLFRNAIYYSNPVHPFLPSLFPNPHLLPSSTAAWIANLRHFEGAAFDSSYPWEATLRGVTTGGFAGPFWLLGPLALLAALTPHGRWLLTAAAVTALPWLLGNPTLRFAIPTMPFLALALTTALHRLHRPGRTLTALAILAQSVLCFPPWIERWNKQWIPISRDIPWRRALRLQSPGSWWRANLPAYAATLYLDTHAPPTARAIAFDGQWQFFTSRLLANPYASEHSSAAVEILERAADPNYHPTRLCSFPLPPATRHARLIQTESDPLPWILFDITPARLSSALNPWDLPRLLDADDVTAWSTKSPRRPGTSINLEFPTPAPTELRVLTSPAHAGRMILEAGSLRIPPTCSGRPTPNFARRSIAQLHTLGWTHLLVSTPRPWESLPGLTLIYEDPTARLWSTGLP